MENLLGSHRKAVEDGWRHGTRGMVINIARGVKSASMSRYVSTAVLLFTTLALHPVAATGQGFPYELSTTLDLPLLGTAAGLFLSSAEYDPFDPSTDFEGLRRGDVNWFDRVAVGHFSEAARQYSHTSRNVLVAGVVALVAAESAWSEDFMTLAVMSAEVAGITMALNSRTKAWTERLRPYAYDDQMSPEARRRFAEDNGDVQESFYSGHTVMAFTAAMYGSTVVGDLYGWSDLTRKLRYGMLGVATTTAIGRVLGGQHYPSDVLVGAGVGMLVGWGVPYLHRKETRVSMIVAPTSLGLRLRVGPD